ncbi:MAG: hypothetical protein ACXWC6_08315 [Ramlibacter sp.]
MDSSPDDRTASLMTPAKLAQVAGSARSRVSPTAFLDRMAADIGHQHVQHLGQLRQELERQGQLDQAEAVQSVLQRLLDALPRLDFAPLQERGWWAGITGKGRSAGSAFAAAFDAIDDVAREVVAAAAALQKQQPARAAAQDRTLVEFDVEYKALDKAIDQSARWLQDMRNQIKARQAQDSGADAQQQIRDDEVRCELLVERLKVLRAAAAASQQAQQELLALQARRSELLQALARTATVHLQGWRSTVSALATAVAADGKAPGSLLDDALKAHGKLRKKLDALLADCDQLRTHEATLVRQLAAMGEQLAAAS